MKTEEGSLSIPAGWDLKVLRRSLFTVYSPDRELMVSVLAIDPGPFDQDPTVTMRRHLLTVGGPKDISVSMGELNGEPTYWGERTTTPGRIFAGCGVRRPEGAPGLVVAVARLVNVADVSTERLEAAGGMDLLCKVAASARDLASR